MSEHNHQVALIEWANLNLGRYPELKWLFAIPNGGLRNKAQAGKLKAEGVKAGVADLCLPVPRRGYNGLWIELKFGDNQLTKDQNEFHKFILANGGCSVVYWDWQDAVRGIEWYMSMI